MTHLLSRGETYRYFQYKVMNLINSQINYFLYIKFTVKNYMNNNDGQI